MLSEEKKISEAGMEVIFTRYGVAEEILKTAMEEDVDVIGISFSTQDPLIVCSDVMQLLKENKIEDKLVIVGGIIPAEYVPKLEEIGIKMAFGPGSYAEIGRAHV